MIFKIARLKRAIRRKYRCHAEHVGSSLVVERIEGRVWRARVEVFELPGHPLAGRCYGWFEERGSRLVCQTKLKIGSVSSPQKAVRLALRSKPNRAKQTA